MTSDLAVRSESHDLVWNGRGASRLDLVEVPEQVQPCLATPIVHLPVGQHPQQGALPHLHVT